MDSSASGTPSHLTSETLPINHVWRHMSISFHLTDHMRITFILNSVLVSLTFIYLCGPWDPSWCTIYFRYYLSTTSLKQSYCRGGSLKQIHITAIRTFSCCLNSPTVLNWGQLDTQTLYQLVPPLPLVDWCSPLEVENNTPPPPLSFWTAPHPPGERISYRFFVIFICSFPHERRQWHSGWIAEGGLLHIMRHIWAAEMAQPQLNRTNEN